MKNCPYCGKELDFVPHEVLEERRRVAWKMRVAGANYADIAKALNVGTSRARELVEMTDKAIRRATTVYYPKKSNDTIIYGLVLTFTHEGLQSI